MAAPKGRSRINSLVPQITLSADDLFLSALVREIHAHRDRLPDVREFDLRFESDDLVSGMLRALQRYPKPAKAYQFSVATAAGGDTERVEIEMFDAQVFRVKLGTRQVPLPKR